MVVECTADVTSVFGEVIGCLHLIQFLMLSLWIPQCEHNAVTL